MSFNHQSLATQESSGTRCDHTSCTTSNRNHVVPLLPSLLPGNLWVDPLEWSNIVIHLTVNLIEHDMRKLGWLISKGRYPLQHLFELLRVHLLELVAFEEHLPRLGRFAVLWNKNMAPVARICHEVEEQMLVFEGVVADYMHNMMMLD